MIKSYTTNAHQHIGMDSLPTDRPWRVKLGMDPTAPDLHLGHAVLLRKMAEFQKDGHDSILVIGSFTAQIGDPTGKNKARPPLSKEDVINNAKTYIEQAFVFLAPDRTRVVYNDEWLAGMTASDIVSLMSKVTVSQMLARDDFSNRMKANEPISMHEMMYPMMQAMDSVHLKADLELGGSDQWFNLHMGRALQEKSNQKPQAILTMPLLVGLDGVQKMSKSLNNHIGLKADPLDSFGRFMSISDETMWEMLPLLGLPDVCTVEAVSNLRTSGINPMVIKKKTAARILEILHGVDISEAAAQAFDDRHRTKSVVHAPRELSISGPRSVSAIIRDLGFADSASDAGRKMEQGGVRIDGAKVTDKTTTLSPGSYIVEVGKRMSCALTLSTV